ncbi:MAG: hypothetical protein K2X07_13810 [Caulobacteraceae bacterium]|nr:hypothetical protein [Caulobacteraceae bacterium]
MLIAAIALLLEPTGAPQDPPPGAEPVIRIDPQIQSWLDRSPARRGDRGPIWDDDRFRGEVFVGVGTGGWRAWGGEFTTPVGQGGRLTVQYRESENDGWRGRRYGYDPSYWPGGLGADDRPLHGSDRRFESGAAGQD